MWGGTNWPCHYYLRLSCSTSTWPFPLRSYSASPWLMNPLWIVKFKYSNMTVGSKQNHIHEK
uniref:Uncharacterized protein n=1 Tax=Myripristis murdjan TaxID=586833 RepID=A0A667YS36_9TELE